MKDIHDEVGYKVGGVVLWPMHTWLSDKLYEAQMYHNDEFEDLDKFINEELPKLLPNNNKQAETNTKIETVKEDKSNSYETNFFKHNVFLVSIGKSLKENKKIYDAARFAWDANRTC